MEVREILNFIDPSQCDYEEWLSIGMALKHEGCTASDWDSWSAKDQARYQPREIHRKWDSFKGTSSPKTVATLIAISKSQGNYIPNLNGRREIAYDWNQTVTDVEDSSYKIIEAAWVQTEELVEPGDEWNAVQDLTRYLSSLFMGDEFVGYVTESWFNEDAQAHLPKKGCYDRTAGTLIDKLNTCDGDIGAVIGDWNPEVGAWIRFNPLDGHGVKDTNVTDYRFALVESDELAVDKQYALMNELELPVAAMVSSGGKSIHAIVKIDADTMEEYRKRVDFLYEVCKRNGLKLDRQNRNPSRLSRLPGVNRGGRKQWLIATDTGKKNWQEWEEWIVDLKDDLPDIDELEFDSEPELAPELIEGILREGHKMLLAASSKAGKSFALIQLAIAMAEGRPWMGWNVTQGRVLYVNLELDEKSCKHRFWAIYDALGCQRTKGQIDVWNLRGSATSMDKLAPKLIRRASKKEYAAVIIDPIYKALSGDENSAEAMALFCNQFDRICTKLGAATIVCHHHSKGQQGHKASQDRSSGSGVFARDPDAIIDLIELEIDKDRRTQIINRWECAAMSAVLDNQKPEWRTLMGEDDALISDLVFEWGTQAGVNLSSIRPSARQAAQNSTGWRIETTLREFPPLGKQHIFFRYPLHFHDSDGLLDDCKAAGEEPFGRKYTPAEQQQRRKDRKDEKLNNRLRETEVAVQSQFSDNLTLATVAETLGVAEKTARRRISEHPSYKIENGLVKHNS